MEPNKLTAVEWLRDLHYQICNGGMAQACFNGYIDDLIETYGSADCWVNALKKEVGDTEVGRKAVDAAELIVKGISLISLTNNCPECYGSGYIQYEEEDDDGEPISVEETCPECGGWGTRDVDCYADVEFEFQHVVFKWDSEYYDKVDTDAIDDLTGQSHNHSIVLDLLERANKD